MENKKEKTAPDVSVGADTEQPISKNTTSSISENGGNIKSLLDDGEECVCVQSISYSLLCRWFQAAVLPLDAALYAEIIKDRDEVKRCCECGATFQPKSNRAKYCAACAKRMRRRKEAERQRKRYWQHEA